MSKFKTYDELSKEVIESFKETQDIRQTAKETDTTFHEVWDMLGYKDYFDFVEEEQ